MANGASRRLWYILGGVVVAAGLGYALLGLSNDLVYYYTPSEVLARGEAAYEGSIRLAGLVSEGSVQWDAERLDLRFVLRDSVASIPVRSNVAPPMMFQEGIEVVVEGRYTPAGVFEAANVMVMHSNEYRELPEGHATPEERYRAIFGESGR